MGLEAFCVKAGNDPTFFALAQLRSPKSRQWKGQHDRIEEQLKAAVHGLQRLVIKSDIEVLGFGVLLQTLISGSVCHTRHLEEAYMPPCRDWIVGKYI